MEEYVNDFIDGMKSFFKDIFPKTIDRNKFEELFLAALKRRVSHYNIDKTSFVYSDYGEFLDKLNLDKKQSEEDYANALDNVMRMLRKEVVRDDFDKTYRIEEPIKYKGANKIIAIIELTNYLDNDKNGNIITVKYGKMPDKFVKDYKEKIGGKIKAVKGLYK